MKTLIALMLSLLSSAAFSQVGAKADAVTVPKAIGSTTYTHCTVTKVEPDGVRISHDGGFAKIPHDHMPEAWKSAITIDPEAAKEFREKQEAANKVAMQSAQEALDSRDSDNVTEDEQILSMEDVKRIWLSQLNVESVSGLYTDDKDNRVGRVLNGGTGHSKFKGDAKPSDSEALKIQMEAKRKDIMSGVYDKLALRAALKHNLAVYTKRGDEANIQATQKEINRQISISKAGG